MTSSYSTREPRRISGGWSAQSSAASNPIIFLLLSIAGLLLIPTLTDGTGAVTVSFTAHAAPQSENAGLVGYWKLDETSGMLAADASGQSGTGSLKNGPMGAAAKSRVP